MRKWKDTSNHWSKNPEKKALVMSKIGKHLRHDTWVGKKRDPEVIKKMNEGLIRWRKENPQAYKETIYKATRHLEGEGNHNWNGGKTKQHGYVLVRKIDHPYANSLGYVREHRLVMEKQLGRFLEPNEIVHHINHNRSDNRPKNLQLFSKSEHDRLTGLQKPKKGTEKNCLFCDRLFYVSPSLMRVKCCSMVCSRSYRLAARLS